MSERAKIELGVLHTKCLQRNGVCCPSSREGGGVCEFYGLCDENRFNLTDKPCDWNLTDPPRFNDAQMAFWRGWYAMGARWVRRRTGTACVDFSTTTEGFCTSWSSVIPNEIAIKLEEGISLDLAELLGKDKQ